jgi:hypothetical protein
MDTAEQDDELSTTEFLFEEWLYTKPKLVWIAPSAPHEQEKIDGI